MFSGVISIWASISFSGLSSSVSCTCALEIVSSPDIYFGLVSYFCKFNSICDIWQALEMFNDESYSSKSYSDSIKELED